MIVSDGSADDDLAASDLTDQEGLDNTSRSSCGEADEENLIELKVIAAGRCRRDWRRAKRQCVQIDIVADAMDFKLVATSVSVSCFAV